jgi:hypothetical protein
MIIRATLASALAFFTCPGFAEVCQFRDSSSSSIDGRISEMKLPGDSTITLMEEESLNEEARAGGASLFTERLPSTEELADRIELFLSANQDAFNVAEGNLNFLRDRLQGVHPPGFVVLNMSYNELSHLQKVAEILSLHRYVQANKLGARNAFWDKLLLVVVGPVVYLRGREPGLFHATALMAMDDRALAPFHEALNWREQTIPGWMEKLVGRGGVKETGDTSTGGSGKLPEGDGIFLLSDGSLPATSSALMSACETLRSPPSAGPVPGKTEQSDNAQAPPEESAAPEERSRSMWRSNGSSRMEFFKATKETDPEVARKDAMARHALAYSWVTTDAAGHRWVHIRPIRYNQKE